MTKRLQEKLSNKFTAWIAVHSNLNAELNIARLSSNRYDIDSIDSLVEMLKTNPNCGSRENMDQVIELLVEAGQEKRSIVENPTFLNPVLIDDVSKLEEVTPKKFCISSLPKCNLGNYKGEALKRATLYNDLIDNPNMEYDDSFIEKYSADIRRFEEFKSGKIPWYIREFGKPRDIWVDEEDVKAKKDNRIDSSKQSKREELLAAAMSIVNGTLCKNEAIEKLSKRRCVEWRNGDFPAWLKSALTKEEKSKINKVLGE